MNAPAPSTDAPAPSPSKAARFLLGMLVGAVLAGVGYVAWIEVEILLLRQHVRQLVSAEEASDYEHSITFPRYYYRDIGMGVLYPALLGGIAGILYGVSKRRTLVAIALFGVFPILTPVVGYFTDYLHNRSSLTSQISVDEMIQMREREADDGARD